MRSIVIPFFILILCSTFLVVTACGGGGEASAPEGGGGAQPTATAGDGGATGGARVIDVEATFYKFTPNEISISVGEPVQFRAINPNGGVHTFTIADLGLEVDISERPMQTKVSEVFVATQPGRYPITCRIHVLRRYSTMFGELVVGQ